MSWEREVLAETVEGLVARNSASLLATQLQSQVRRYLEAVDSYAMEVSSMRSTLSEAERIGLAVMRAAGTGRKTVRVADLVPDAACASATDLPGAEAEDWDCTCGMPNGHEGECR